MYYIGKTNRKRCNVKDIPLASTCGVIDDSLGSLDLTEALCILLQSFIIGGGVETADVDVAVARNMADKALLQSFHVLLGGEDRRHSSRDWGITLEECIEVSVKRTRNREETLRRLRSSVSHHLLRGGGSISRSVRDGNVGCLIPGGHATKEGSGRSRLGSGVRGSAVVQSRNVLGAHVRTFRNNSRAASLDRHELHRHAHSRWHTLHELVRIGARRMLVNLAIAGKSRDTGMDTRRSIAHKVLAIGGEISGGHHGTLPMNSKTSQLVNHGVHAAISDTLGWNHVSTAGKMVTRNLGSQITSGDGAIDIVWHSTMGSAGD